MVTPHLTLAFCRNITNLCLLYEHDASAPGHKQPLMACPLSLYNFPTPPMTLLSLTRTISARDAQGWVLLAGACFGAGLDIISAADIRYCSADAYFCVKEVDLAIAADMGVLQRLPGLIGQGSQLCHTVPPTI